MVTFNWRNVELPLQETIRLFVRRVIGGKACFQAFLQFYYCKHRDHLQSCLCSWWFSALLCLWFCKVRYSHTGQGSKRGEKTVRNTACKQFFSSLLLTPSHIIFSLSHHFWPSKMKITLKNHLLCSVLIIRFIKFFQSLLF